MLFLVRHGIARTQANQQISNNNSRKKCRTKTTKKDTVGTEKKETVSVMQREGAQRYTYMWPTNFAMSATGYDPTHAASVS